MDNEQQQQPQPGFFGRLWKRITSMVSAMGAVIGLWEWPEPPAAIPVPVAQTITDNIPAPAALDHMPRTLDELMSLPVQEKLLLSAVTASGCDAVAYYTPDGSGALALAEHIDIYPERRTRFEPAIAGYKEGTFASDEAVAANAAYHIPVYVTDAAGRPTGALRGVIVLHAPDNDYSRVQTQSEQANPEDMHEPAYIRKAKLEMAAHIVEHHQDMLGGRTHAELVRRGQAAARHATVDEKIEYFTQLAKDMFATFTRHDHIHPDQYAAVKEARTVPELTQALRSIMGHYDSRQALHVLGVTDLTRFAVDAVNKDQPSPVINPKQAELVELLALLHDVGKTQMSSKFFNAWKAKEPPDKEQLLDYVHVRNHNHPLFTLVTLLLEQQEGLTAAAHHHGLFRYSTEELEQFFGKGNFDHYSILKDNVPPSELPALSKIMRVADVTGAMTDAGKPLDQAILEQAQKAGLDLQTMTVHPVAIGPGTMDPDSLCLMIDNGMFKAFGEKRERDELNAGNPAGWVNQDGHRQYDPALVEEAGKAVLAAFGWEKRKAAVAERIRHEVMHDAVIRDNPVHPKSAAVAANGR